MAAILEVENFSVSYGTRRSLVPAVRNVSFSVQPGEIIGIAGESGSGKSTLCKGAIRALSQRAQISGNVKFDGQSLYDLPIKQVAAMHGRELAMVLQNPMTSLDPLYSIGNQVGEVLRRRGTPSGDLSRKTVDALRMVHLTAPELRVTQYPHQLSGGMRQRTLIAMATSAVPKVLVADEPTSALDATIQDEILLLFRELRDRTNCAVLIVTHEMEVIRRLCDRVMVMYAGSVVEQGRVSDVFASPRHPYTRALIGATPKIEDGQVVLKPIPGQVPDQSKLGVGCAFAERCDYAADACRQVPPPVRMLRPDHGIVCRLEEGVA